LRSPLFLHIYYRFISDRKKPLPLRAGCRKRMGLFLMLYVTMLLVLCCLETGDSASRGLFLKVPAGFALRHARVRCFLQPGSCSAACAAASLNPKCVFIVS